jgi:predicted house-cleaning noncanonical NTP pyrophosphatase (MazG superfamily)
MFMTDIIYNKLVRDGIIEKIKNNNETPIFRELNEAEFKSELLKKLIEEAKELLESPNLEERADIEEILIAIDEIYNWKESDVQTARTQKKDKRGNFSKRIFLEKTIG